jgi:hypothetical protein
MHSWRRFDWTELLLPETASSEPEVTQMWQRKRAMGRQGDVLLDLVLVVALVLLGAFALDLLGITFWDVLHGAAHFFGA